LDNILSSQRSPSNKTGLGYDQNKSNKGYNSTSQESDKNPKGYVASLQSSLKREEDNIKVDSNIHKSALLSKENEFIWNTSTIRIPPKMYQHLFLGYFFSCNKFGHKAIDCRTYGKNNHKSPKRHGYKNKNNKNNQRNRNYNSFSPLQDYNVECCKCNNYVHKTNECRLSKYSMKTSISNIQENYKKTWRRKSEVQRKIEKQDTKIDEVDNRRMIGEVPNKECEN
jgi:hypothetical protein